MVSELCRASLGCCLRKTSARFRSFRMTGSGAGRMGFCWVQEFFGGVSNQKFGLLTRVCKALKYDLGGWRNGS